MKKWRGWVTAVVALLAMVWFTVYKPEVLPGVFAVIGVLIVVLICANVIRTRRRRTTVAHTLRPDAREFIALQDDLLGRVSNGPGPENTGPVATSYEQHDDPEGNLTDAEPNQDERQQPE